MAKELYVSLKIDLSKFKGGMDEAKAVLQGIEGSHSLDLKVDSKPALDSFSRISIALSGIRDGMHMIKSAWENTVSAWVSSAQTQERAVKLVDGGLRATGNSAKLTSAELQKIASGLQELTNFGDEDILANVTSPLITFRNVAGETFKEAQELILDMSEVLGQDLKSSAIQVGKALNDPIQGVTALRRVGVQLSDQQEKQVKDFMAVNDIASAQKVILAELASEFGGQARNVVDPLKQLKNTIGDIAEQLGNILLPVLRSLASIVKDTILPAVSAMISFFDEYGKSVITFVTITLSGYITQLIVANFASIKLAFSSGSLALSMATLNKVLMANGVLLIAAAFGFLASQIMRVHELTGDWKDSFFFLGAGVLAFGYGIINTIMAIGNTILYVIQTAINPLKNVIGGIIDAIRLAFTGDFKGAIDKLNSGIVSSIKETQKTLNKSLSETWKNVLNDPLYDDIGKALYDKLSPKVKLKKEKDSEKDEINKAVNEYKKLIDSIATTDAIDSSNKISTKKKDNRFNAIEIKEEDIGVNLYEEAVERADKANQELLDSILEREQEKARILQEYEDFQYELTTSSEQKKFDVINAFYNKNKESLLEMGLTEEAIESQRAERLKQASEQYKQVQRSIENVKYTLENGLANAFTQMIIEGRSFVKVMDSLIKNLVNSIIQEFTRLLAFSIIRSIFGFASGGLGSIFGSAFSITGGASLPAVLPQASYPGAGGFGVIDDLNNQMRMMNEKLERLNNKEYNVVVKSSFKSIEFAKEVNKAQEALNRAVLK